MYHLLCSNLSSTLAACSPVTDPFIEPPSSIDTDNETSTTYTFDDLPLADVCTHSKWNFFDVVTEIQTRLNIKLTGKSLDTLYSTVESLTTNDGDHDLLQQSYRAFLTVDDSEDSRIFRMINGDVVTDSGSDDAEDLVNSSCRVLSEQMKQHISKRRQGISRKKQRDQAKLVAKQRFLSRRVNRKVRGILLECPDIGKEIETFASESNVGADAWRRTGVLTFDGNKNIKEKVM